MQNTLFPFFSLLFYFDVEGLTQRDSPSRDVSFYRETRREKERERENPKSTPR